MASKKPLFMESTQIGAGKTAAEIQSFLVQAGARQVLTVYDDKREISGLHFTIEVNGAPAPFELPVRVDPIFKILNGRRQNGGQFSRGTMAAQDRERAKRVAWRQLYRWVQAQLALIDCGMVAAAEVFMPYLQVAPNETLYQRAVAGGIQKLLPAPPNS